MDGMRGLGPSWIPIPVIRLWWRHTASLFSWGAGGWDKLGGDRVGWGSDPPPPSASLCQRHLHLSFRDVGKRRWSDKDLRFCKQAPGPDSVSSLVCDGWIFPLFVFHLLIGGVAPPPHTHTPTHTHTRPTFTLSFSCVVYSTCSWSPPAHQFCFYMRSDGIDGRHLFSWQAEGRGRKSNGVNQYAGNKGGGGGNRHDGRNMWIHPTGDTW